MYVVQKRTNLSRLMNKKGCQCRLPTKTRRVLCEKDGVSFLSLLSDSGSLGGGLDLLLLGRSDGGGILRLTLDRTGVVTGHLLGRAPVLRGRRKYKNSMDDRRARVLDQGPMTTPKKKEKGIRPPPYPHTPATPFLTHHLLVGDVGGVGSTLLGGPGCGGIFLLRRGFGRLRELGLRRWGVLRCRCVDGLLGKEVRRGWVVDSE